MNESTQTARWIIKTLIAQGVTNFVLCPGSRCAPLSLALAQLEKANLIKLHVETDERVAGFVALGFAKVGAPTAIVTTSGTAVANLHPAIEEALHSALPLLVLSADRPHSLRGVRASQTTDHMAVLAGSVKYAVDIPVGIFEEKALANQVRRAVRIMRGIGVAGQGNAPVHINVAFAEPLLPDTDWNLQELQVTEYVFTPKRTVIVAGSSTVFTDIIAAQTLLSQLPKVPIIAEPTSVFRTCAAAVISAPILLQSALRQEIERVIVIGQPTLTREVNALLADPQIEVLVVDEAPTFTDISGNARKIIMPADISNYVSADEQWFARWQRASQIAEKIIGQHLQSGSLTYPAIADVLAQSPTSTFLGASSVIREINLYARTPKVFAANRGLAGIDGTISTAIGMALATGKPLRVVVGDLTFVHDLGALVRTKMQANLPDLQVVVIDDEGGSIFATLEYGKLDMEVFDRVFRTAKDFSVKDYVCSLKNVTFTPVKDLSQLRQNLDNFCGGIDVQYINLAEENLENLRRERQILRKEILCALNKEL